MELLYSPKSIELMKLYIPIEFTTERQNMYEIENSWGYFESVEESNRVNAPKGLEVETLTGQFSWEMVKKKYKKIMILADAGMGKTTLLRMEGKKLSQQWRHNLQQNNCNLDDVILPILIRFDDLAKTDDEVFDTILSIVNRDYPLVPKSIRSILNDKLATSKCSLLIDALDEVPIDKRIELAEKMAISGFPNNKIAYNIRPVLNLHSF